MGAKLISRSGADGGIRTHDPLFTKQVRLRSSFRWSEVR